MKTDVATKQDISDLRTELKGDISDIRTELKGDISDLRMELRESFNDLTSLLQGFIQQVDERFNQVEAEQAKMRAEIAKIFDYLDDIVKKQQISDDERLVMGHQLERLDRWVHELAEKIGYKLAA